MIHEKIFQLKNGREVKVIVKAYGLHDSATLNMDYEILVREPKEQFFRTPIGINHPQYWKLKKSNAEHGKALILEYSGINQKQINQVKTEFNRIASCSPAALEMLYEEELI